MSQIDMVQYPTVWNNNFIALSFWDLSRTTTAWLRICTIMLGGFAHPQLKTWMNMTHVAFISTFAGRWGLKDHRPSPFFPSFIFPTDSSLWQLGIQDCPHGGTVILKGSIKRRGLKATKNPLVKPMNWMGWKGSFQGRVNSGMYRTLVSNHTQISVVSFKFQYYDSIFLGCFHWPDATVESKSIEMPFINLDPVFAPHWEVDR